MILRSSVVFNKFAFFLDDVQTDGAKEIIRSKVQEYLGRAEKIKTYLKKIKDEELSKKLIE